MTASLELRVRVRLTAPDSLHDGRTGWTDAGELARAKPETILSVSFGDGSSTICYARELETQT